MADIQDFESEFVVNGKNNPELEFLKFFDATTMSIHLKENQKPLGKRGMPGSFELVEIGEKAGILFVCQRPEPVLFRPMWERDPKLSRSVFEANLAGVKVWCITLNVSETEMTFYQEIPVNLEPPKN